MRLYGSVQCWTRLGHRPASGWHVFGLLFYINKTIQTKPLIRKEKKTPREKDNLHKKSLSIFLPRERNESAESREKKERSTRPLWPQRTAFHSTVSKWFRQFAFTVDLLLKRIVGRIETSTDGPGSIMVSNTICIAVYKVYSKNFKKVQQSNGYC